MTMTELVPYRERPLAPRRGNIRPPADWLEAAELSKSIANTDFVPRSLRGNPAAITAAVLYGDEVGLGPMQSLAKIAVIDGRPALAAESQRALILQAGHELWLEESTVTRATWAGRRLGSENTTRITWTLDDAKRAGLAGRPAWRTYPRQMLSARASAELARAAFPDAIGGLLAIEEAEDLDDGTANGAGAPPAGPSPARSSTRSRRARQPAPPVSDAPEPPPGEQPPLPGEQPEPPADEAARRRMFALFREAGIPDRGDRLAYANRIIEREVSSSTELTASEVQQISAALTAEPKPAGDVNPAGEEAPGPGSPLPPTGPEAPDDESYAERRELLPATDVQLTGLDELIQEMRELELAGITDVWRHAAELRGRTLDELADELNGRDSEARLNWLPLRASITRSEAGRIRERLLEIRREAGHGDDVPY